MVTSAAIRPEPLSLEGKNFSTEDFKFRNLDTYDPSVILDVADGNCAGAIFHNFLSPDDCRRIASNFWKHPDRYARGDDVPAEYVGTFHYKKALDVYLDEAEASNSNLDLLFEGAKNPVSDFFVPLKAALERQGASIRIAQHQGREAGHFIMRSWSDAGDFALRPHEDEAQCRDPLQKGFEIQCAADNPLLAVNICLENGDQGSLWLWNIIPDHKTRENLDIVTTGYPYPIELLEKVPCQKIPICPGDLYCFNGKFIHAVEKLGAASRRRATIAFLMGRKRNSQQMVCWS